MEVAAPNDVDPILCVCVCPLFAGVHHLWREHASRETPYMSRSMHRPAAALCD